MTSGQQVGKFNNVRVIVSKQSILRQAINSIVACRLKPQLRMSFQVCMVVQGMPFSFGHLDSMRTTSSDQ
eukprot:9935164-Karenia_brevis.AAC.1